MALAIATCFAVAASGPSAVFAAPTGQASKQHGTSAAYPKGNAFDIYVRAGNLLVQGGKSGDATSGKPGHIYTLAEKDTQVRANAPAIALLRSGLNLPYAAPPVISANQLFPYYRNFRSLIRMLALTAEVKMAHGDATGAMNCCIDSIQFGQQIERGAPLIGRLTGIACQVIAQRAAWPILTTLPPSAARQDAQRLQTIIDHESSYSKTLEAEKAIGHYLLPDSFRAMGAGADQALAPYGGKKRVVADFNNYMDTLIQRGKGRYAITERMPLPPIPKDPINSNLVDVYWGGRVRQADVEQTQNALLLTALALRAYRAEHNRYPQTLAALCPTYLRQIPEDVFASTGQLRYRLTGSDTYLLYSVGPDGVDDGGKAIDNPAAKPASSRYAVAEGSRGDIVAGVSR